MIAPVQMSEGMVLIAVICRPDVRTCFSSAS
jgi:hypothetical protein